MKKTILKTMIAYLTCLLAITFIGCSRDEQDKSQSASETDIRYLTVKGSDTMVHLVSSWAEVFMNTFPNAEVSVTGGGSGTGIAALINGTTDICAASREIKKKEQELARQKNINPHEISVALDGIAVVVNPANPINSLTIEQIGKIFSGAVTNWDQVGGPSEPIIVLSRESSSGTYVFFQEKVLNKADYSPRARLMPGTAAVVQAVAADKWSIGYVGLGYAAEGEGHLKVLTVKTASHPDPVIPSVETIKSGEYPISRALYFYTNGIPTGLVKDFVDFCLSKEGQQIVQNNGYVQVN